MADPITIGTLALSTFQLISSAQQAGAIRDQARLAEQINNMNAEYAELDAFRAEEEGLTGAARYQNVIDSTVGAQQVALASQDVDINYGTAKEIQEETKLTGYLNQLDIKNQAHARALGFKREARNTRLQSALGQTASAAQVQATQTAGLASAFQTGLSGYSRLKG